MYCDTRPQEINEKQTYNTTTTKTTKITIDTGITYQRNPKIVFNPAAFVCLPNQGSGFPTPYVVVVVFGVQ
jgi:hypothetical protein